MVPRLLAENGESEGEERLQIRVIGGGALPAARSGPRGAGGLEIGLQIGTAPRMVRSAADHREEKDDLPVLRLEAEPAKPFTTRDTSEPAPPPATERRNGTIRKTLSLRRALWIGAGSCVIAVSLFVIQRMAGNARAADPVSATLAQPREAGSPNRPPIADAGTGGDDLRAPE